MACDIVITVIRDQMILCYRLYDREGNGYITTSTLKEILAALDDKLSSSDLDGIIAEIDTDGSGTVDFDGKYLHSSTYTKTILNTHAMLLVVRNNCDVPNIMIVLLEY